MDATVWVFAAIAALLVFAIAAGTIRRAYLKGLGSAAGCAAPAAPRT